MVNKTKSLTLFGLVMLITGAIDSIRNMPATALFGEQLIFFFIFAALVFLIPVALVSAELSARFTQRSGIFVWTEYAFGPKIGFLAIWLQWINTVVWYPTILSFIAGTAAYLINPALANNKIYLVTVILAVFWLMTLINLRGLKTSANVASISAIIGLIIPVILIIVLALCWIMLKKPIQLDLTPYNMLPHLGKSESWISLTAIVTSFLGIELACVHANKIHQPQKAFPKALGLSTMIILTTMICGALAIALVLPRFKIHLVDGIMESFQLFFHVYHLSWLTPVLAIMILIGSIGGMINWIISPAKGLQQAAAEGFLPKFFAKENKNGVASHVLLTQAGLVSIICLAFLLIPSVNGSYWLLTDLSTELYVMMYVLMFLSMLVILYKQTLTNHFSYRQLIPGGKFGTWVICIAGLFGCALTLIVGFFPPAGINVGSILHYETLFGGGIIVMLSPLLFFYFYQYKRKSPLLHSDHRE